jgi:hypothetical protein
VTTVALVAAKNAAASIADTVRALHGLRGVAEVWVVDDGSDDATALEAEAAGARVVRLERNRGKGGALAAGLAATPHAERYLLADADLGATAASLQPLLDADDSFVVGVLPSAEGRGGFGAVKTLAAAGIQRATNKVVAAPLSGQRVVDGPALRALVLAPRFGVEVGMTIDLLRDGVALREVPVPAEHEHRGRSLGGFAHRGRQGIDVVGALASRLATARQQITTIVVAAVVAVALLSTVSYIRRPPPGEALPGASHVVLFPFDGLSLDAPNRAAYPNLQRLRRYAAVGALSVRTTDRRSLSQRGGPERPSLDDAYASLGASARVRWTGTMPESRRQARRDHADSLPGALGDALHRAGKQTAVVQGQGAANAALADSRGRVDSRLAPQPSWSQTIATALRLAPVVLLDPGETNADARLGELYDVLPRNTLLLVFSPTPATNDWELTPVLVASAGIDGPASIASETTHRAALGGLVDLAPTVLDALGVEAPSSMTGAPLRVARGAPDLAAFERLQIDGAVRSRFFLPAAVGYTVVGIVFYLAFMAAMRAGVSGTVRRALRVGVCAMAAFPFAILVNGAVQHWWHAGGESPTLLVLLCLGLGALAARLRGIGPAYALAAATVATIVVDVAATGPLHAASILGYSIQTSGRYYGLPNASFAVFAASLFLVAAAVAGWEPNRVRATAATAVVGVGVVFVAAPWLGNDVGGTLTLLPIGLAAAWAWFGQRFTRRTVVVGAVASVAIFVMLALLEAASGGTHLGRAATSDASFLNTLTRRFDANFGLLVDQWWGFLSIALAVGSIAVLWRPDRFADYLPTRSGLRIAALATLVASIVGFVVNDSGPVVNVLCLVVLAPAVALSSLAGSRRVIGPAARS